MRGFIHRWAPGQLAVEGYSASQIGYHAMLMAEAGLVTGVDVTSRDSEGPCWLVTHLTWEGHEFLDAARNDTTWAKAKVAVTKVAGGAAFGILKGVLTSYGITETLKLLQH